MKKVINLMIFCLLLMFALPVSAQETTIDLPDPGTLPDSPMYFLKPLGEKIKGIFIFGEDKKALYALTLADKRLGEAKALSDKGESDLVLDSAEKAGIENENAQEHLVKAETQGKDVTAIVERLLTNSMRQQEVLAKVLEKVPEKAKVAIQKAMEMSKKGLMKAQEMQSKEKGAPDSTGKSMKIGTPSGSPASKPSNIKPTTIPTRKP